ncbi:MAG TPA: FAD-binding oxidoreductase [Myxococcota bacterium]
MQQLSGWGRVPVVEGEERLSEDLERASEGVSLSRGLGRSYGDASLPASSGRACLGTRLADRILAFDDATGVLRAEAGFSLHQLNQLFLARGWTTPVIPGTQYVTLGGMVAADVHGKNHHVAGCLGAHVRALRLRVADGRVLEVSAQREPELFRATLGGMGLTGHILEVELRLQRIPSAWIWRESERVGDLEALVSKLRAASRTWPFTVAWVDCAARGAALGRGILSMGRWAEPREAPAEPPRMRERFAVPFDLPSWCVGPWSIRLFNALYYGHHGPRPRSGIVHPQPFFFPLDAVRHWNRLYGRRGMVQYQCVLPLAGDGRVHQRFFETLARHGGASPVSVIKDCGAEGRGLLSFPMPGISVALDLPFRKRRTQALVDALNAIVIEAGGRVYLAKDALTRREHFAAMEPRLERFRALRHKWDPEGRLASAQSVRLLGDAP